MAVGLSGMIEVLQVSTGRGLCEFDDVMHNFIETAIDIGTVMIARRVVEVSK